MAAFIWATEFPVSESTPRVEREVFLYLGGSTFTYWPSSALEFVRENEALHSILQCLADLFPCFPHMFISTRFTEAQRFLRRLSSLDKWRAIIKLAPTRLTSLPCWPHASFIIATHSGHLCSVV